MKKYQLGEFEEVVMLTVAILHDNAYGVSVKKEIESRLSRNVSVGALQTAQCGSVISFRSDECTRRGWYSSC